jgi:hypothetical protein
MPSLFLTPHILLASSGVFLRNPARQPHIDAASGVWRSLVARFVRDEEAVGSNPATPTNKESSQSAYS